MFICVCANDTVSNIVPWMSYCVDICVPIVILEYTSGGMGFHNGNGPPGNKMYFRTFLPLNGFYTNGSLSDRATAHHILCEYSSGGQWHDHLGNMVGEKPDGCIRNRHDNSCGALYRSGDDQTSHLWMFPQNGFTNRVLQCRSSGGQANSLGIFITDGSEFISRFVSVYWNL